MPYSPGVDQGRNGIAAALMNIAQPPPQSPSMAAPILPMQQPPQQMPPPGAPPPIPQQGQPMPPPFAPPGMPGAGNPLPSAPPLSMPIVPRMPQQQGAAPAGPQQMPPTGMPQGY